MTRPALAALLLAGLLGGGGGLAWAQRITLSPSLTVSEEFDDNILQSSTDRQSDFVTSVSPGLRLTLTEYPWTVTAGASLRGVYYAGRSDLNSSTDNREGSLAVEFRPTARFSASLTDTYVRSFDPGEADPTTGITVGRFASTRNTVTPAMRYQLTPLTDLRLQYSFSVYRSDTPLIQESDTHEASLGLERRFSPTIFGTLRYTFNRFEVERTPARNAHLPRAGVVYVLSPTIRLSADAGPLFVERADGSTQTTVGGTVEYAQEFQGGRLSLVYDRIAGVSGALAEVVTSQSLTAVVSYSATRTVAVALDGGVRASDAAGAATDFLVYTAGIRLDYRILRWLSVNAGYRYFSQDDRTGLNDVERNVVFIGLTASTDIRVY